MADTKTLYTKLIEFQLEVGKIRKTGTNPHFRSKYADINAVLQTIMPVLTSRGIIVVQLPDINDKGHVLITKLINADNPDEFIESTTPLILPAHDMQKYGSATTYARRYSLISMLNLETVDDDGNMASQQPQVNQYPQGGNNYGQVSRG